MFEIVVLSGKGGTGKTSFTAAFAHLADDVVICDLDVDAPDLHLLLHPKKIRSEEFVAGNEARIIDEKCTGCGLCVDWCQFDAIKTNGAIAMIDAMRCEGCKVCVAFCPEAAVAFEPRHCGQWYVSDTRFGPMAHARLFPGEENSGKLVALLRQEARQMAPERDFDIILSDGPPGIGCPVISSLSGSNMAVLVTEPTPSGMHDLARIVELCQHFRIPMGVIINKHDLNRDQTEKIESYCAREKLAMLGKVDHSPAMVHAMVKGLAVTEDADAGDEFSDQIRRIWDRIKSLAVSLKDTETANAI